MHYLMRLSREVDKTHPRLGNLLAFAVLCAKARRCLLIVAPAGCGKSTVTLTLQKQAPDMLYLDSVTRNGLKHFEEKMSGFCGLVIIDDLGKVDTTYSRISTATAFAELCYSHFVAKYSQGFELEINDFHGAAVLNAQPPVLAQLVASDEWETVLMDKTVRYYHLFRPVNPLTVLPDIKIDWGIDIDVVKLSDTKSKLFSDLVQLCQVQWSQARAIEHCIALLRACAALDRRDTVGQTDMRVLGRLMRPLLIEPYLIDKYGFESARFFKSDFLAILVEFATYKNLSISTICRDYKVSREMVVSKLRELGEEYISIDTESKTISPAPKMLKILEEGGAI